MMMQRRGISYTQLGGPIRNHHIACSCRHVESALALLEHGFLSM
jgi:hypothetical protein